MALLGRVICRLKSHFGFQVGHPPAQVSGGSGGCKDD